MEKLADPFGDRVVTDFPPPPVLPLSEEILFPSAGRHLFQYTLSFIILIEINLKQFLNKPK